MQARCRATCYSLWRLKLETEQILRLALLAPDIIEVILAGRTDQWLMLERLERPPPMSWEDQRSLLA